jgi:prepilin-type N-terminal cleavage/methylation domain-containing protein
MKKRLSRAVTLIELAIALAIFAVVIVVALEAFSKTVRYTRESIQKQSLQDHAQFLFELMSKEIKFARLRTATADDNACAIYFTTPTFSDPRSMDYNQLYYVTSNNQELRFINYQGLCVRYFLAQDNGAGRLKVERYNPKNSATVTFFVTPQTLNISNLYFSKTDLVSSGGTPSLRKPATVTYFIRLSSVIWDPPILDYYNFITARNFNQF